MGALTGDPLSQFIDEQRVEMCEVVGLVTAKCPLQMGIIFCTVMVRKKAPGDPGDLRGVRGRKPAGKC